MKDQDLSRAQPYAAIIQRGDCTLRISVWCEKATNTVLPREFTTNALYDNEEALSYSLYDLGGSSRAAAQRICRIRLAISDLTRMRNMATARTRVKAAPGTDTRPSI